MKAFIFAVASLLIAAQAHAASPSSPTIIVVSILVPNYKSPLIQTGFQDSAFDYNEQNDLTPKNKSICFIGKAADVCPQIRNYEKSMNAGYRGGAHDNIRVNSCRVVSADTVETSYELSSDYDNNPLRVERTIKACAN